MTTVVRTERRPLMTRMTEPWPRLMDWFEAMVPADARNIHPIIFLSEQLSHADGRMESGMLPAGSDRWGT